MYNSLAAQRDACSAYIASQKHEGWQRVKRSYDDGGFSGGSLMRPALQALLEDVAQGDIHIIVVYKIDRLTRSLADFAWLTSLLDRYDVSFIAVTQQFNTATSMGRLTLNVLLTFAQFEREIIGERISDKKSASRKRGLWMGGHAPLGYDVESGKLVINPLEADTVRHIFRRFVALGSMRLLRRELTENGIVSKCRIMRDGSISGGIPFSWNPLQKILSNPVYRGMTRHKQTLYRGQHQPIVTEDLFREVETVMLQHVRRQEAQSRTSPYLLRGLIFDRAGERLYTSHCCRGHRKYRYYLSRSLQKRIAADPDRQLRVSAPEVEKLVTGVLASHLRSRKWVSGALSARNSVQAALVKGNELAADIETQSACNTGLIAAMVTRIEIDKTTIRVVLDRGRLAQMLLGSRTRDPLLPEARPLEIIITDHVLHCRRESRIVVTATNAKPEPDRRLIDAIDRAQRWFDALASGGVASVSALAEQESVTTSWVSRNVRLAFLAPDIVDAIRAGTQAPGITLEQLRKACPLPVSWGDQRQLILAQNEVGQRMA